MKVSRKITRFGNSLGITIPSEALNIAGLEEGDSVELYIESRSITIVLRKKSEEKVRAAKKAWETRRKRLKKDK